MDDTRQSCEFPRAELYFGSILVAHVASVFCSDDTWYGVFEPEAAEQVESSPVLRRLYEFIKFCVDWNDRHYRNPGDPPDADEFDAFSDVIDSDSWFARTPQGDTLLIDHAPVFQPEGAVSWRPR